MSAEDLKEINRKLLKALRPFARHVGKTGSKVTLTIGDDTWTHTLTTYDFERASAAVREAMGVKSDPGIPIYSTQLATKGIEGLAVIPDKDG